MRCIGAEGGNMKNTIDIRPLALPKENSNEKKFLLELQLRMATSSINHEYARLEFDDIEDRERREELLEYMNECHSNYFEARSELSTYDPYALVEFETDLMRQKQMTLKGMQA